MFRIFTEQQSSNVNIHPLRRRCGKIYTTLLTMCVGKVGHLRKELSKEKKKSRRLMFICCFLITETDPWLTLVRTIRTSVCSCPVLFYLVNSFMVNDNTEQQQQQILHLLSFA